MSLEVRMALVVGLVVAGFTVYLVARLRAPDAAEHRDVVGPVARGLVLAFVTLGVATTIALVLQGRSSDELADVVAGQQASRVASLISSCHQRNADRRKLRTFVETVAPELADDAARAWPVFDPRRERELCVAEARRRAATPD